MNQNERDALVDRYLAGRMNSREESDFFLKVAVDPELQRTLKSYQIFDRVVDRDREMVPSQGRYRGHVMALLAATKVATGGGAAAGLVQAQTAATVGASGGAAAAGLFGLKGIVAAVIGVGVLGGTVAVVVPSADDPVSRANSDAVQQERTVSQPPVIPAPVLQAPVTGEKTQSATDVPSISTRNSATDAAIRSSERKTIAVPSDFDPRQTRTTKSSALDKAPEFKTNDRITLPPTTSDAKAMKLKVDQPEVDTDKK